MRLAVSGLYQVICIVLVLKVCECADDGICDRRPLGTTTQPLPPDNRYLIEILKIKLDQYIPKAQYEVRLYSRDNTSAFIAFTIYLREDTEYNKNNPRKPKLLQPGELEKHPDYNNVKFMRGCNNTIIQSDITPKTEVKVMWTAPPKNNKCVTVLALVAEKPDVWYHYEGPLSKKVCEDRRKADDMQPMENDNCKVKEDARYQLIIEGMWSLNTHPLMFPTEELAKFSDVVGATHDRNFALYKYNSEATEGLKMLAEQGNTTELEIEILRGLVPDVEHQTVRTLLKATAPLRPNQTTVTNFRVTPRHHLVSLATAILPSPDWFLGVSNLELCDAKDQVWAENVTLNLYPMDAGTDSGTTFTSPNEETSPPQPITSAVIANVIDKEQIKPFARLLFHLVRTYSTVDSNNENTDTTEAGEGGDEGGNDDGGGSDEEDQSKPEYRPPQTPTTSEEPVSVVDPETEGSECPMTTWSDWDTCQGECIDNVYKGYHSRYRENAKDTTPECVAKMSLVDYQPCEEECHEEEPENEYEEEE